MTKEIKNRYKFRVSGIEREVNSFKGLLDFVIYDYEVFEIEDIGNNEVYSEQEKKLIGLIIGYQDELDADLEIVRFLDDTEPVEITKMPYVSQLSLLRRKHRFNRGIFYLPTAGAYTSTTLNKKSKEIVSRGRHDNSLYVADIITVVKRTMELHNGTKVEFKYPFKVDNEIRQVYYLEDLYSEAERLIGEGKDFKLVNPRLYYSRETIRNINRIRKKSEDRV